MWFKTQVHTIVGDIYHYALFYNFAGGLRPARPGVIGAAQGNGGLRRCVCR